MQALNTRSQERINQMNSSAAAFRQLIESLRSKNRSAFSEVNPQTQRSNPSQTFVSEKDHRVKLPNTMPINLSTPQLGEDDVIKLKPKGNVAGRDVINKKTNQIHSSKFTNTAQSFKLPSKQIQSPPKTTQKTPKIVQTKFINEQQVKLPAKTTNLPHFQAADQLKMKQSIKNNFNQKKFNSKFSSSKKIKDIDETLVESYCTEAIPLSQFSQPNDIFDFFQGLMGQTEIGIASPLIKKFKNCVYFGHPIQRDQKYEGFLYFYDHKFYYGEFMNSQKHGQGVEIMWELKTVYKGIFKQGQKSGKFYVKRPGEEYIGFLEKGLYSGHGKLTTPQSVYEGEFYQGEKHGLGEQFYPKTGFKFTGYFQRGVFTKRSKSSFSHNPSYQQLQKGIVFKSKEKKNMNRTHSQFGKTKKQIPSYMAPKTSRKNFEPFEEDDINSHPFMVNKPYIPDRKRKAYNKQKIKSFLPNFGGGRQQIPENCKDFDYSFDVSSKRDSQMDFNFAKGRKLGVDSGYGSQFSRISQQNMDNSEYEQPLPVPCFFKAH